MPRRPGPIRLGAAAALAGVSVGGCGFHTQTTRMAVDYNDFIAATTNKQTVLNVLRASRREPMHFTSFSEVVGTVRGTGAVGVNVAANGDNGSVTRTDSTIAATTAGGAANGGSTAATLTSLAQRGATNVAPALSLSVVTGTDFKVAANATDEFYRGIMTPVAPAMVVNYLRQGFPADLLSHLLIGRLEYYANITDPDGAKHLEYLMTLENHPGVRPQIDDFAAAIRCRELDYTASPTQQRQIEAESMAAFGQLAADQIARVESVRGSDGKLSYRLTVPAKNDFALAMSESHPDECARTQGELDVQIRAVSERLNYTPRRRAASPVPNVPPGKVSERAAGSHDQQETDRTTVPVTKLQLESPGYFNQYLPERYRGDLVIDVTLRSVEGVLYYLGEYVRSEQPPVLLGKGETCSGYCLPILRVRPVSEIEAGSRFVQVDYRGQSYAVPLSGAALGSDAGRSSQTIDLVQQLLNLNRSAKDLPSTPLVRVYN